MKLIPAIDLKDNKCVRLTQGKEETSKVYNENPVEQAKYFEKEGELYKSQIIKDLPESEEITVYRQGKW